MIPVDVIFLSAARTPELKGMTDAALASLASSEDPHEIQFRTIVIESFPNLVPDGYAGAHAIFPKGPFGYHKYMNIGIRAGTAPFVCMCNNDIVFHRGWARAILDAFEHNPELMSASPYCGYFHGTRMPNPAQSLVTGYVNGIHVAGWCLFVRRCIFEQIGHLDERFSFWFCDDDYRLTLQQRGVLHGLVTTSRVDHLGSLTIENEPSRTRKERMTSRQALFFQYKWVHKSLLLYALKWSKYTAKRLLGSP
jgi:GT2 family glycosyltransferase